MGNVVIYDLASKINSLQNLPTSILCTVTLPRTSVGKNYRKLEKLLFFTMLCCLLLCIIVNVFLPYIVNFFLHEEVDLLPIRILSLSPLFLSISVILGVNFFIGFGYTKYTLTSIIVTTIAYLLAVLFFYVTGNFKSVYSFVIIALFSYAVESFYKIYKYFRLKKCNCSSLTEFDNR